ncbi:MAG: DNA polymerase IV [Clostridia bacterium]|nr:DNA polymerase IV [Clostridia bacterium]
MAKRIIFHCDANSFFASCEIAQQPKLGGYPIAVGGDPEARHGIVLAANPKAKKFGVRTAMTISEARGLCPGLLIVPPTYNLYDRISCGFKAILRDYSDITESYGIDEEWVDVTHSLNLFADSGFKLAEKIRKRVYSELGITVSIGIAENKYFAKMGSDYKKPDACTEITPGNFKELLWPLPVGDLFGCGPATQRRLYTMGINTIGELARTPRQYLTSWFHKPGADLHAIANGQDRSEVNYANYHKDQSVSHSFTAPRDLENEADCCHMFLCLAEAVSERVRRMKLKARTVQIMMRDTTLQTITRRTTLQRPTNTAQVMTNTAMEMLRANWQWNRPIRNVGLAATNFVPETQGMQMSLFEEDNKYQKTEILERVVDDLRGRYGHYCIGRGILMKDKSLGWADPTAQDSPHAINFGGRK